jgi:hypothetical protein
LLAFLLLVAGFLAVIFAPTITAGDIGLTRQSLDDRLKQTTDLLQTETVEQQRISEELQELAKQCTSTIRAFLVPLFPNEVITLDTPPDDKAFHALNFKQFPTPRQIADALTAELQKPNRNNMTVIGVSIAVEGCDTFNFTRSRMCIPLGVCRHQVSTLELREA